MNYSSCFHTERNTLYRLLYRTTESSGYVRHTGKQNDSLSIVCTENFIFLLSTLKTELKIIAAF